MALIKCKECGKEVSDKADKCPNCGCPVSYSVKNREQEINHNEQTEWKPMATAKANTKQPKMKNSVLSFVAFIISLFGCGCISIVGTILAIIDLKSNDKSKKHDLSVAAIIIMAVWWFLVILFFAYSDDSSDKTATDGTTTEQAITQEDTTMDSIVSDGNEDIVTETESTTEKELTFDDKVKELLGEELGSNLLKILKDNIGFTELSSIEKVGDTLNYKVDANGYEIMVTEISDTDFRIIIPNSDYVFYENGSVSMTFKDFSDRQIDINDRGTYYIMAQDIVKSGLKNPSSADFPSITFHSEDIAMQKKGDLIVVQSYVDAENSFGGTVRSKWTVQFMVIDKESFSCQPTYISIDGDSTGEFIDMD